MTDETRNKAGVSRRDFLGKASFGAIILSSVTALAGVLRLTKPNVYYEESRKFRVGNPENYPVGFVKKLEEERIHIFSDENGLHAITAVCTHLGCIVALSDTGFDCPCHGSRFSPLGEVVDGPAAKRLRPI